MKLYRDDVRARMLALGRDPDSCKVLFMVTPIVGETVDEARAKAKRMYDDDPDAIVRKLALLSSAQTDFSQFDLDAPLPDIDDPRGTTSIVAELRKRGLARDGYEHSHFRENLLA